MIVTVVGLLTLFGWFIDEPHIESFVNDDATQWFDILASFAIFLGALNLMKLQSQKILKKKSGWQYSIFAILGFLFAITVGFFMRGAYYVEINKTGPDVSEVATRVASEMNLEKNEAEVLTGLASDNSPLRIEKVYFTKRGATKVQEQLLAAGASTTIIDEEWGKHVQSSGTLFSWMFFNVFTPLSATMFALLAFFVASASYRAFKIRNFEATLLLISGIIIMIGRVPLGSKISSWFVLYLFVLGIGVLVNTFIKNRTITFAAVGGGLLAVTIAGFMMGWPIDKPAIFFLPTLQDWIYNYPNLAGTRAIMMGIGLGIIATSIRYILGIEKSYIGE
tara:strand:- start:6312 stop:7316 length:1005 start_codon:yes stop_codon:yes gene_type:complete